MRPNHFPIAVLTHIFICTLFVCSPCAAQEDCSDVLNQVRGILDKIKMEMPSGSEQQAQYKKIGELLSKCPKIDPSPSVQLEIQALRIAVQKKLKQIDEKKSDAVPEAPESGIDWEMFYRDCYRMYVNHFDLVRHLSCDEAATLINQYYDQAWDLVKKNQFQTDKDYPLETVQMFWRLLYRLSSKDCAGSKSEKMAVQRVFFPHPLDAVKVIQILTELAKGDSPHKMEKLLQTMRELNTEQQNFLVHLLIVLAAELKSEGGYLDHIHPEKMGRIFVKLLKTNPQIFIQLIGAMDHLSSDQRLTLLSEFTDIAMEADNTQVIRFRRMLSKLPSIEKQNLELAISMLHKVPWSMKESVLKDFSSVAADQQAIIGVYNFLLIDAPQLPDLETAKAINEVFQRPSPLSRFRTIPLDASRVKDTPEFLNLPVGASAHRLIHHGNGQAENSGDVELIGSIQRNVTGGYLVHLRFLDRNHTILFRDTLELAHNVAERRDLLQQKAVSSFQRFNLFIVIMRLMDAAESHIAVSYMKDEKPAAFIQRTVTSHSKIFGQYVLNDREKVESIIIHPEFWKDQFQGAWKPGSGYDVAITDRLYTLYYRSYHALVSEQKKRPVTLEVYGEYFGLSHNKENYDGEKQYKFTIVFVINHEVRSKTDLYLPTSMVRDQEDMTKQLIAQIVCRAIALLLDFKPEPLSPQVVTLTDYPLVASFFMPGIWRTQETTGTPASALLRTWNYSNLVLLGIAIATELTYISSDYENDALFWTAVGGTGLFILNGAAGVIDAYGNRQDIRTVSTTCPYIGFQYSAAANSPAFIVSIPF